MYSKFVAALSANQQEMRNRVCNLLMASPLPYGEIANRMKISRHTLKRFIRGGTVYQRAAWKIAVYLEKVMQEQHIEQINATESNSLR